MTTPQPTGIRIAMFAGTTEITSRVQAARLLNEVNGPTLHIYDLAAGDLVINKVEVYATRKFCGQVTGPQANWSALGSVDGATTRRYAEMLMLASELIELASES
jgi:hypothetical protein